MAINFSIGTNTKGKQYYNYLRQYICRHDFGLAEKSTEYL